MNDLFNIVYEKKKGKHTSFWGKYDYLNQYELESYNDSMLWRMQITRLKIKEQYSFKFDHVNEFLKEIEKVPVQKEQEELLNMSSNAIYTRILEILNAGLFSSDLNPKNIYLDENKKYKDGYNAETLKKQKIKLVEELEKLSTLIESSRVDSRVKRLSYALGGLGIKKRQLKDEFIDYKSYKANEAEILMVEALNRHKGWRALQSGQLYHKGQQLLEDAFVFDANINIDFGKKMGIKIKNKEFQVQNLNEFFNLMNDLNYSESIYLSDELYEKIREISLFSAQAKSGVQLQHLLNSTAERNTISLQEISDISILEDLHTLYQSNYIDSFKSSKMLEGLTNYWLSKSIARTNISKNELYFTKDGFQTASKWMEMHKQMLKFNPALKNIQYSFFIKPHPYIFKSVKN